MDEIIKKLNAHYPKFAEKLGFFGPKISGLDALMVWQYVRHSERYQALYKSLVENYDEYEEIIFCGFFGMSQPVDFREHQLPPKFHFKQNLVVDFDVRKFLKGKKYQERIEKYIKTCIPPDFKYFSSDGSDPAFGFVVNLNHDPDSVAKMIKHELVERRKELALRHQLFENAKAKTIKASSKSKSLMNWLISYHYKTNKGFKNKNVIDEHYRLNEKEYKGKEIDEHVKQFKIHAELSPGIFFLQTF